MKGKHPRLQVPPPREPMLSYLKEEATRLGISIGVMTRILIEEAIRQRMGIEEQTDAA